MVLFMHITDPKADTLNIAFPKLLFDVLKYKTLLKCILRIRLLTISHLFQWFHESMSGIS